MHNFFLLITGPTGTGKSAVALDLARHLPIEIINGDMGQLYTPLNIGTAKPTPLERMLVPHHLFDILDEPVNFTVAQYHARVHETMREIWKRNNIPVVVGGSGFYIKSLFYSPEKSESLSSPASSDKAQEMHLELNKSSSNEELWSELNAIDPARAAKIHPNDRYRIERALALWRETGELPSSQAPIYEPITQQYQLILLTRDRVELYARIDQRVNDMMPAWLEEVRALQDTPWAPFLCKKKIIGYCDLLKEMNLSKTSIATIQRDTRRYAKRQLTFFRSLLEQLPTHQTHTINMTNQSIDGIAEKIRQIVLQTPDAVLYSREQK